MTIKPDQFDQFIFISDAHLGAFSEEKNTKIEQSLIDLVNYARTEKAALFVLGDLFDYWMEYPKKEFVPDLGKDLLNAFEVYNREIFRTPFITGNHDHWTYGYFEEKGFIVEPSYLEIEFGDQRFLLTHGDGHLDGAFGLHLPLLHRFLKNPTFIEWYQKVLPPSLGLWLMKSFSRFKRRRQVVNTEPLSNWSKACLTEYDFNVIISGHDHFPRLETLSSKLYLNLGTFYDHKTVGLFKNNEFNLVKWDAANRNFQHYPEN